ncbi:MAG: hypothetical protein NZ108_06975, partial [Bacteroidia bacterium]|nr:hypothetical protein [Bacteroidia bacterium]
LAGGGADSIVSTPASSGDFLFYTGAALNLQSSLPNVNAASDTVTWDIIVSNISTVQSRNTWFSPVPQTGTTMIVKVVDLATNTEITPVGNIYQIGTLNSSQNKTYRIFAKYTNCIRDSVTVHAGWNCSGYPVTVAAYPCQTVRLGLKYTTVRPTISVAISGPFTDVNLCDTLQYEVTYSNISAGIGYSPTLRIVLSTGLTYIPNSAEYAYPGTGSYQPFVNPIPGFNLITWFLDSIPAIKNNGLRGSDSEPNNQVKIRFKLKTACSYTSGNNLRFFTRAKGGCGFIYTYNYSSPLLTILGAPETYATNLKARVDTIRSCTGLVTVRYAMINLGPGETNNTDIIRMTIPEGTSFVVGSGVGLHNPPAVLNPTQTPSGSDTLLEWILPPDVPVGDSVVFTFQLFGNNTLTSSTLSAPLQSAIAANLACGSSFCSIFSVSGSGSAAIEVDRPVGKWTGLIDRDWFKDNNWSNCKVPECDVNVEIPLVTNLPEINNTQQAYCQNLQINSSASVDLLANSILNICGNLTVANNAAFNTSSGSTVRITGSADQTVTWNPTGNWTVDNLTMAQTTAARLIVSDTVEVKGNLTLNNGIIDNGIHDVRVLSGVPTAVTAGNANSFVRGRLRRNVSSTGTYFLPVGNAAVGYELAELNFSVRGTVSQLLSYFVSWPGSPDILNQSECAALFDQP